MAEFVVPRGEPYVLRASARDGSVVPDRIMLTIHSQDKTSVLMKEFGKNDFRHDFAVVEQPLELELEGGDDDFGPILLEPVDRPRITNLELTAQHPRQSERREARLQRRRRRFDVPGEDAAVPGDRGQCAAGRDAAQAAVGPSRARPICAGIDATHFVVEWTQEGPGEIRFGIGRGRFGAGVASGAGEHRPQGRSAAADHAGL